MIRQGAAAGREGTTAREQASSSSSSPLASRQLLQLEPPGPPLIPTHLHVALVQRSRHYQHHIVNHVPIRAVVQELR